MRLFTQNKSRTSLTVYEMTVFAMLGTIMYVSKVLMEAGPNIHLVGMFTVAFTVIYRKKALVPIYVFVFITGLFSGFALWWIPYLYIWTVLWGATMLLPKNLSDRAATFFYCLLCCLHGLFFGILYAPGWALMYGLSFQQMLAWISAGFTFDLLHTAGNFAAGLLILPTVKIIKKINKTVHR